MLTRSYQVLDWVKCSDIATQVIKAKTLQSDSRTSLDLDLYF